jgi:LysM repeat protein
MMGRLSFIGGMLVVLFLLVWPNGLSAEERYKVKSGDSLYAIAKSFGISVEALREANGLAGNHLKPNQVLLIPNPKKRPAGRSVQRTLPETEAYTVKQGESLYTISKKAGLPIEEIKRMNGLQTNVLRTGQKLILIQQRNTGEEELEELGDAEEVKESLQALEGDQNAPEALGKWKDPDERSLFIRVVKNFLGVPYRLGGSTLKGIDCSAFVKKMFEIFNVEIPRTTREQLRIGKKVKKEDLEEGDVVFFKTQRASRTHVGIYIGNNEFIHASYRSKEVRVDSLDTPYFNQRFINGVRIIELEKES